MSREYNSNPERFYVSGNGGQGMGRCAPEHLECPACWQPKAVKNDRFNEWGMAEFSDGLLAKCAECKAELVVRSDDGGTRAVEVGA